MVAVQYRPLKSSSKVALVSVDDSLADVLRRSAFPYSMRNWALTTDSVKCELMLTILHRLARIIGHQTQKSENATVVVSGISITVYGALMDALHPPLAFWIRS